MFETSVRAQCVQEHCGIFQCCHVAQLYQEHHPALHGNHAKYEEIEGVVGGGGGGGGEERDGNIYEPSVMYACAQV